MSQPLATASLPAPVELLALRVLSTALRCREIGGGLVTYRKIAPNVVPGERLTVRVEKRWTFRRTDMVGGELLHAGFSLRAIDRAGHLLPQSRPGGDLSCPGGSDERLLEAQLELEDGQWIAARALLLDVLEDHPGCLVAHARLGNLLASLAHVGAAMSHFTAAIRLGMGALSPETSLPLDSTKDTPRALLEALVGRAALLAEAGRKSEAAADLRRALTWDSADVLSVQSRLDAVDASAVP